MVLLCSIPLSADSEQGVGTLIVQVQGLKSDAGDLRFVLFDSKERFLKNPIRAEIIAIAGRKGRWVVTDIPYGSYAVLVHHDVNGNGKMERHWYGKPKEPAGASNDPAARMGPPLWKKTRFELASDSLEIAITVK